MAGGGGDSRWLISYADLVTLLMAFFVALYGISQADTQKFNKFLGGLGPFGNEAAVGDGVLDGSSSLVGSQSSPQSAATDAAKLAADTSITGPQQATYALKQSDVDSLITDLRNDLAAKGLQDAVRFRHDSRGLVAAIATDQVLFETGSSEISPRGREIAAAIGPQLSHLTNEVIVEGHTDNVPLNRAGYNNWNLSTDRAVAVVRLLQESFGLNPERLTATGYGEFRPVASNADAKGRSANRRVEIVVIAQADTAPAGKAEGTSGSSQAPATTGSAESAEATKSEPATTEAGATGSAKTDAGTTGSGHGATESQTHGTENAHG